MRSNNLHKINHYFLYFYFPFSIFTSLLDYRGHSRTESSTNTHSYVIHYIYSQFLNIHRFTTKGLRAYVVHSLYTTLLTIYNSYNRFYISTIYVLQFFMYYIILCSLRTFCLQIISLLNFRVFLKLPQVNALS